jgi:hypothetical protein
MTKNTAKIKEGIKTLAQVPNEVISGKVIAGSINAEGCTMSVQLSDDSAPIEGVMLTPATGNSNGVVLFPKDGSDVIIASIDGPGEWFLVKASDIARAKVTIENVTYEMDDTQINVRNGPVLFNVGTAVFKMNTASESLYQLLNDLITGITHLTVGTPAGASTVPVNVATFSTLLVRLNNLMSA